MHTAKVHRKWHPEAGNNSYLLEAAGENIWKHINTQGKQVSIGIAKEILLINWLVMFFLLQCGRERLLSVHLKWSCQCPHESRSSSKRAPCRTIWEWRVWAKILAWFARRWVADMKFLWYCWWKKSCTTKDDDYPMIYSFCLHPRWCRILSINSRKVIFGQSHAKFFVAKVRLLLDTSIALPTSWVLRGDAWLQTDEKT